MTASRDEAKSSFTEDAPAFRIDTSFYVYLDDTAIGRSSAAGDRDTYALRTDSGGIYTFQVSDNSNGFPTTFDVLDRNGTVVTSSTTASGTVRLSAVDTIYYIETRSGGAGFYTVRVSNALNGETSGRGEIVTGGNLASAGPTITGALDVASDSDHFTFNTRVGHSYRINFDTQITTPVSDLTLFISTTGVNTYTNLPFSVVGGVAFFSASENVAVDLALASSGFRSTGAYSFVITDTTQITFRNGTSGADSLTGDATNEQFVVGNGDDTVNAGGGNDTLDGGTGQNYLRGDDGNDSLLGGAAFDDLNGNMGNDTVSTGAGEDYCVGGKDNDSLSGGADYDIVYGNLGDDTCNGDDGNDIVRGGQGDDVINGGAGADFVSGDKGSDTVTGGLGADSFHTFGDAGLDRVLDFSLAQGDRVQLDPGTQFSVAQVAGDTVISMTGGGQMILVGISMSTLTPGWIFGA